MACPSPNGAGTLLPDAEWFPAGCASGQAGSRTWRGPPPRRDGSRTAPAGQLQEQRSSRASVCPDRGPFPPGRGRRGREAVAPSRRPPLRRPAQPALGSARERRRGREWWVRLARAFPAPLATVERDEATLPFVELAGISWDDYLAARAASSAANSAGSCALRRSTTGFAARRAQARSPPISPPCSGCTRPAGPSVPSVRRSRILRFARFTSSSRVRHWIGGGCGSP